MHSSLSTLWMHSLHHRHTPCNEIMDRVHNETAGWFAHAAGQNPAATASHHQQHSGAATAAQQQQHKLPAVCNSRPHACYTPPDLDLAPVPQYCPRHFVLDHSSSPFGSYGLAGAAAGRGPAPAPLQEAAPAPTPSPSAPPASSETPAPPAPSVSLAPHLAPATFLQHHLQGQHCLGRLSTVGPSDSACAEGSHKTLAVLGAESNQQQDSSSILCLYSAWADESHAGPQGQHRDSMQDVDSHQQQQRCSSSLQISQWVPIDQHRDFVQEIEAYLLEVQHHRQQQQSNPSTHATTAAAGACAGHAVQEAAACGTASQHAAAVGCELRVSGLGQHSCSFSPATGAHQPSNPTPSTGLGAGPCMHHQLPSCSHTGAPSSSGVQDISAEQTQNVCRLFEGDDTTAADMGEVPSGVLLAAALHAAWSCQEMVDVDCADGAAAAATGDLQQAQAQYQQQQNPYPWWEQQQSQYSPVSEQFVAAPGSAAGYGCSSAAYGEGAKQHSSSAVQQPQTQQKKTTQRRSRLGTAISVEAGGSSSSALRKKKAAAGSRQASSVGAGASGSIALKKKAAAGSSRATQKTKTRTRSRNPKRCTATTATPAAAAAHPAAAAAASPSAVCAAAALTSAPAPPELATPSTKGPEQQQQQNGACVSVVCGQVSGVYDSSKHMIQLQDGSWVNPSALERLGGLGHSKQWRRSVRVAAGPEGGEQEARVPLGKWLEVRGLGSLTPLDQVGQEEPAAAATGATCCSESVHGAAKCEQQLQRRECRHKPAPAFTTINCSRGFQSCSAARLAATGNSGSSSSCRGSSSSAESHAAQAVTQGAPTCGQGCCTWNKHGRCIKSSPAGRTHELTRQQGRCTDPWALGIGNPCMDTPRLPWSATGRLFLVVTQLIVLAVLINPNQDHWRMAVPTKPALFLAPTSVGSAAPGAGQAFDLTSPTVTSVGLLTSSPRVIFVAANTETIVSFTLSDAATHGRLEMAGSALPCSAGTTQQYSSCVDNSEGVKVDIVLPFYIRYMMAD